MDTYSISPRSPNQEKTTQDAHGSVVASEAFADITDICQSEMVKCPN